MKLQRNHAYYYKARDGKTIPHFKHTTVIPEQAIEKLGWKGVEELDWEVRGDSLILKPKAVQVVGNVDAKNVEGKASS